jgi:hypothetical protein
MEFIISTAEIESTKSFQKLDKCFKIIALKLSSKKIISTGLLVFRSSGVIPGSVAGNNLKILNELIQKEK